MNTIHTHHHHQSSSEVIKVIHYSTKNKENFVDFVSERCKDFMCRTVTDKGKGIRQSGVRTPGMSEDTCQAILSVIPHLSQETQHRRHLNLCHISMW